MIDSLVGLVNLDVAGHATPLKITHEQLEQVYLPLLATLREMSQDHRVMVGLAGVPGGGKSTFVAALSHMATQLLEPGAFVAVAMDGWHYPNAVLDTRTTTDAAGNTIPLRQRKGGPESFDVAALADALENLKNTNTPVQLPAYDRRIHDPVPNAITITPQARIILVEGNYLLLNTPPWNRLSNLFRPRIYLHCDPQTAGERVMARHVRGGNTVSQARERYERNDRLNIELVAQAARHSDWTIFMEPVPRIQDTLSENARS